MKMVLIGLLLILASNIVFPQIGYGQKMSVNELCKNANESVEQIEVFNHTVQVNSRRARILTPGGSPVAKAIVVVAFGKSNNPSWSSETSEEGNFEFPALKSGKYFLTICKQGYNPVRLRIAIPKRFKYGQSVTFRMSPS